ncbi:MFS transporter [Amycolatopsis sp. YIM 10]|uniref:MFS transporter n=1 Tax=Amycolatopsis sp. YIM 10 TaxID=2653857 RepID=UPI0012A9C48C|nr:MFS transporter [Amycolatopsis sp. YIM 10]QFU94534.1 Major Facilitator Superfamily protein [Amycolatopsis sp. YIM 10]
MTVRMSHQISRRRTMAALFTGVACMNVAMAGASTAGVLIATESPGPGWSGVPAAAGVLGTAAGALGSARLVVSRGRRRSLLTTYGIGSLGALVAAAGAVTGLFPLLLAGLLVLGLGNGGAQLSRYAAADLYDDEHKGRALSAIVWAGTVGALAGPPLIAPAADTADLLGLPGLAGPLLVAALVTAGAAVVSAALPRSMPDTPPETRAHTGFATAFAQRSVRGPLLAMVAAQVAMVAMMTMSAPQLHQHGHGLDVVGWILTAHMIGMFALAPISGRIADRWGGRATIFAGIGTLAVASAASVAAPTSHTTGIPLSLFLLGYGWNLVFVGGSSLLSKQHRKLQGTVDAVVWSTSALAGLAAGPLFALGGYVLVAVVAGIAALIPLVVLTRR